MKKTLLTILQLLVTSALLYWVFHDPAKREEMGVALRTANFSWVVAALSSIPVALISPRTTI